MPKSLVYSILWSFTGDSKMRVRHNMSDFVRNELFNAKFADVFLCLIDYGINVEMAQSASLKTPSKIEK